jgi:hypothetical protein
VNSLWIHLVGNEWVKEWTENHTAQEEALGGSGLTPPVKPQWVHCKLD